MNHGESTWASVAYPKPLRPVVASDPRVANATHKVFLVALFRFLRAQARSLGLHEVADLLAGRKMRRGSPASSAGGSGSPRPGSSRTSSAEGSDLLRPEAGYGW
ncbi:MAG: hypothetical protein HY901_05230 [Deltaproteobacteria bacterium]|nr:hypothetical protein [Deltaproteobacteria bacterium]